MDGLIQRCLWVGFFVFFYAHEIRAQYRCEPAIASIVSVEGQVEVVRNKKVKWQPVGLKTLLCAGDTIRIGTRSRAAILLTDQTVLRLDQGTSVSFPPITSAKTNWLDLLKGAIHFISRTPGKLGVKTPFVNAAIEGTEFVLRVEPAQTALWVYEGRVAFSNTRGRLSIESGEAAIAKAGLAPQRRLMIKPEDAVQWALYYPPIIDFRSTHTGAATGAVFIDNALRKYRQNDLHGAFKNLDQVPPEERDISFYNTRAAILLSVGRVDEAQPDIEKSLELDANNASGYALKSIIALAKNQAESSLSLAQQAVKLNPESPVPQIALSYAHQAQFDIENALESAEKAAELSPRDALAWSRVSELRLSQGDLDGATEAAEKAVELDPGLARTQTIMGFADLTRLSIDEAQAAFDKAIEIDPSDPLPQLGSGLAMIRRGKLKAGAEKIEIAASLDPDNALIRSYLGKAYFEQKRGPLAETEFARAKQLDPNDPTPWFYDAIQKQSTNRPVEALHDLQKAIELNDNRAVYRSSLLLDQDVAARSASLGRIYRDLGFQQRALVEGWRSVNTDPTNFSAHRLLADSYSALPRHEIARVSELLQAQLLQPINTNPIQPQLNESNLGILDGAGPTDLAFNEFNPLFTRNRVGLQINGTVAENDTWGDDVVLSGVHNQFSYSFGQFHFETDGLRDNNEQKHDIANAFVQAKVTAKTSVQAEYRYRRTETGDLNLFFNPEQFSPNLQIDQRTDTYRFGLHHAFTPNSDVIFSAIVQDIDLRQGQTDEVQTIEGDFNEDGYTVEGQYLFNGNPFSVVAGLGHFDGNNDSQFTFGFVNLPLPATSATDDFVSRHTNAYLYAKSTGKLAATLGLSFDSFKDNDTDTDRVNPKLGLTWALFPSSRIRLAAFRVLKRPISSNQTIEPTQVAGFNQFFNDANGTISWRYGAALDQVFSESVFGGLELSKRDLKVPFRFMSRDGLTPPEIQKASWDDYLGRAYLFWTPTANLSTSLEYQYERFDRPLANPADILATNLVTHRIPIGINYYHPSGFITRIKATFIDQNGDFVSFPTVSSTHDADRFWIIDTNVGYRLPKRLGLVSIGVKNLFNKAINFQDTDPANPTVFRERQVFAQCTLNF